jgi:hypothetical protein
VIQGLKAQGISFDFLHLPLPLQSKQRTNTILQKEQSKINLDKEES